MANVFYDQGFLDILDTTVDLLSDTVRVAIVDGTYTPDATAHTHFNDITGEITGLGYIAGGVELTDKAIIDSSAEGFGAFDAGDVSFEGAVFYNAVAAVVYVDTGVAATSTLLAYIDFYGLKNAPFTLTWNANGIFSFRSRPQIIDQIEDFEDADDDEFDGVVNDWDEVATFEDGDVSEFAAVVTGWDGYLDFSTGDLSQFDATIVSWGDEADFETGDLTQFDAVADASAMLSADAVAARRGSFGMKFDHHTPATALAYGRMDFAVANQTSFNVALWLNASLWNATLGAGEYINLVSIRDAASDNRICLLRLYGTAIANTLQLRQFVMDDGGGWEITPAGTIMISNTDWIHISWMGNASSAPAADDGYTHIFINGDLIDSLIGIDNDTAVWDWVMIGKYTGTASGADGELWFDMIFVDEGGAPLANTLAAREGTYGMMYPFLGGNPGADGEDLAAAGNYFCAAWWYRPKYLGFIDATSYIDILNVGVGANRYITIRHYDNDEMRIRYFDDLGVWQESIATVTGLGDDTWKQMTVIAERASAPAANDGTIFVFIDGILVMSVTNVDNDTRQFQRLELPMVGSNNMTGAMLYYDEIYFDRDGSPFASRAAARNGTYGMMVPFHGVATYGQLNLAAPPQSTGIVAFWYYADSNLVAGTDIFWAWDASTGQVPIIARIQSGGATGVRLRVATRTDAPANVWREIPLSLDEWHHIIIYWRQSTGPGNDDGVTVICVDAGDQFATYTGVDNDTYDWDFGLFGNISGFGITKATLGMFDDIRVDEDGSFIPNTLAALEGNYGAIVPFFNAVGVYGYFNQMTNQPHITAEFLVDLRDTDAVVVGVRNSIAFTPAGGGVPYNLEALLQLAGVGDSRMLMRIWEDIGAPWTTGTTPVDSAGTIRVRLVLKPSSVAGADDGWATLIINDEIRIVETGLNNDTKLTGRVAVWPTNPGSQLAVEFYDEIWWDDRVTFANPFAPTLEMWTLETGSFADTITDLASIYAYILPMYVSGAPSIIVEQKPEIDIPGIAAYKVIIKNHEGTVVAEFDDWLSLSYMHIVNDHGTARIEINGEDPRIELFETDTVMEIWRRNLSVGLPWYKEWIGLCRTFTYQTYPRGRKVFVIYALGYLELLNRRIVAYYNGTVYTGKDGIAETVLKEYVNENAGPGANNVNRLGGSGVIPGFSVEPDLLRGDNWEGSHTFRSLLDVVQELAFDTGLYVDVVDIGDVLFEFKVFEDQRGVDRTTINIDRATGLNSFGYEPIIFSLAKGNIAVPVLSHSRRTEVNVAYALGQGTGDERNVVVATTPEAIALSPWNRREWSRNAVQMTTDGALTDTARALLQEKRATESFNFNVIQVSQQYYGLHYWWGDRITSRYDDIERDKIIWKVKATIAYNSDGEELDIDFKELPADVIT